MKKIPLLASIIVLLMGGSYIIRGYTSAEKELQDVHFTIQNDGAFNCDNIKEIPTDECKALVSLYKNTDGPNRIDNERRLTNKSPCSRRGVLCKDGHIASLNLSKNNLSGTLPANIAWLSEMFALYLADNNLSGTLPTSLLSMKNLEHIELSKNNFTGTIPKEVSLLGSNKQETLIFLDHNSLCYTIPESLQHSTNIELMRVRENNLTISEDTYNTSMRNWIKNTLSPEDIKKQYPELCE